jgi:LPXTG-motif cell wall-anchored protein
MIFGLPNTATRGQLQIAIGLALLIIAWLLRGDRKQIA